MDSIAILVLAAGLGKRFGSDLPKVALKTCDGKALVQHVLEACSSIPAERVVVITGHKRELVEELALASGQQLKGGKESVKFAFQEKQLGTGDAVKSALPQIENFSGTVLILYGDVPLIRSETLEAFLEHHQATDSTLSVMSFSTDKPHSYGRIERSSDKRFLTRIIEARDCQAHDLLLSELNSGILAVDSSFLVPAVKELKNDNAQKEYYLTDIVERASNEGQTVTAWPVADAHEVQGVNTRQEMQVVNEELQRRRKLEFINSGVEISDINSLFVDRSCQIEAGAVIGPQVSLKGTTKIASGAVIEGCAYLQDCDVGAGALIKFGVRAEQAAIGPNSMVGPFAHLRPGTTLGADVKIGNFVETKKAVLQDGAKASHLTYLGDCHVGTDANIGAGTITCNYDGFKKSTTEIGQGAFIGSNSSLVAPVKIGRGATVGAGSVVTKNVPEDSLAVARAQQTTIDGWSKKNREKNGTKNS